MADTAIAITAGTGTNVDTRTEGTNGNHRQVVVLGDPATNAGVAPVDATAGLKVDLGADNDITGTVTANLGATDNAVLDAIESDTTAILADTTAILADTAAIETATEAVQAAVEGTLTVAGTVELGATDNAVLDDIASDTEAIKTATQLIDDVVFADDADWTDNTSKHINVGGVYQATPHTVTDGDVSPFLTDANGRLVAAVTDNGGNLSIDDGGNVITVDGTVAVTHSALTELGSAINSDKVDVNIVSSDVATGGTSAADDADFTDGTTSGTPAMGVYESTPSTVTDGDLGVVGITEDRKLKVQADLGATDNAVLDDIAAKLATIDADTSNLSTKIDTIAGDTTDIEAALETAGGLVVNLGANNDVTVTGTVDLGATDNAVLDDIAADTEAIKTSVAAIDTDATTIIGHLDGVETLLGTIDADTGNIATSLGNLDNSVDGNYLNVNANIAGTDMVSGSGTATGALRVELPTNGTGVIATVGAVTAITNALPAGTNGIGKLTANSGVDIGDVDVTSISAGTNAIGNVGLIGRTTGGLTIFRSIDLDESEEEVKATAGQVFSITAFNRTAAPLYLKLYNATAANVSVGSTTPVMTFVVPGNADSDGAGFIHSTDIGYAFGTAICAAVTTGVADADTGAPGANDCIVNIGYV
jgi:hypothetical protein